MSIREKAKKMQPLPGALQSRVESKFTDKQKRDFLILAEMALDGEISWTTAAKCFSKEYSMNLPRQTFRNIHERMTNGH